MSKKLICLICGEKVSMQMDLDKLTISTDCKNAHHFRSIPFNSYFNFLPSSMQDFNLINNKNKNVFYCFICQKNVELNTIKEHNKHDGVKLSLKEFLSRENCIEFNSCIKHNSFEKYLNKIGKLIEDIKEWKKQLDKKYEIYIKFLDNLFIIEKNFFDDILKNDFSEEIFYDYESLINIKEIYMINNSIKNFLNDYNYNTNFSKLSYFFINKIKNINEEENNISIKNIKYYYKTNKCYFNEEIKYKNEKSDNIYPLFKSIFKECDSFIGYDSRYYEENEEVFLDNKLGEQNFHKFLLHLKNNFPHPYHLSQMRNKNYFSCATGKEIIIIKNNNTKMEIIKILTCCDLLNKNYFSNVLFSLELTNEKLIGISENYLYAYESLDLHNNNIDFAQDEFYNNYFNIKKIKLRYKIDDIIQITPTLFCTFSVISSQLSFWDIKYIEIVSIISDIKAVKGNPYYLYRLNNSSLLITGEEYIYIISIKNMDLKLKIRSNGFISCFCLLPKNGILCGEMKFNYGPYNPFNKDSNEYNLVQYQISENEIKKISEKKGAHKNVIRNLFYLGNNVILSCSLYDNKIKIWY